MPSLNLIIFLFCIFIFSIITTAFIRQYSLRNSLIDIPNERSSHSLPTPRGGGLSISLSILMSIGLLYYLQLLPLDITIALGGGGLLVAIIGWLDDHINVAALWRIIGYTIATCWAMYWLDGLGTIHIGGELINLYKFGTLLSVIGVVWLTNLYNFMDGTDAFAGTQAVCASIFSGILFFSTGLQGVAILCFVITVASAGFLYWNWPPAKIFMGDVGSCLIGFCFGILAILGQNSGILPIAIWVILLAVFLFDATLTLLMRIIKKEKWYEAHRTHAYQRLIQMGVSHKQLAIGLFFVNIFFLFPLAYVAYYWSNLIPFILLIIVILMCSLWSIIQITYRNRFNTGNLA